VTESHSVTSTDTGGAISETATIVMAVPQEWPLDGYARAMSGFRAAGRDPRETFLRLFEALNYAASIILAMIEKGEDVTPLMQGIRYARNCVHHAWADALVGHDDGAGPPPTLTAAGGSRVDPPTVIFDWFWKPVTELKSERSDERGRTAYAGHLAGHPARETLEQLERTLNERSLTRPPRS
jgi:hypothetical protein